MLKISKIKLEKIGDPEISDFFRKSIRCRMCFIATRKAKSDYRNSNVGNCKKWMTHIRDIDRNNVYGSQMPFGLTTDDYRFEDKVFIKKIGKNEK